jgi:hypothetical protein
VVYCVCVIPQGDPLQLFSLCEVLKSDGTGPDAKLTVKVIDSYWDKPMNFLPQGGGPAEGEEMEVLRKDLLPANPVSQDQTPDLADLDKCAADLPVNTEERRQSLLTAACCALTLQPQRGRAASHDGNALLRWRQVCLGGEQLLLDLHRGDLCRD